MPLEIWTGFVVGILGSIHCIGMCGPIALALPSGFPTRSQLLVSRLLYNGGRVLTYAALGAVSGLLGKTIAMAGFQQSLSIAGGVAIVLMVLLPSKFAHRVLPMQSFNRLTEQDSDRLGEAVPEAGNEFVIRDRDSERFSPLRVSVCRSGGGGDNRRGAFRLGVYDLFRIGDGPLDTGYIDVRRPAHDASPSVFPPPFAGGESDSRIAVDSARALPRYPVCQSGYGQTVGG